MEKTEMMREEKHLDGKSDKSLEEAAEEYTQKMLESWRFDSTGCRPLREPFIAGAEWQASQMPMPEDTVLFNKGVAEGRRLEREDMMKDGNVILAEEDLDAEKEKSMEWGYNLCKEQMLKDAVEGYVSAGFMDRKLLVIPTNKIIESLRYGDKVRILVLKTEEE